MTGNATGGFGRTFGSIAAIGVAIALVVAVVLGVRWARHANEATQDTVIITQDSLERAVGAVQRTADVALAKQHDSTMRAVAAANVRTAQTQAADAVELAALRTQLARKDSALAVAKTPADSAVAAELARPPSLDSTIALLAAQHAADSGATAAQATAASSCLTTLTTCAANRARADSIAGFFKTAYLAEKKKQPTKLQSTAATIGEVTDGAAVLFLLVKLFVH